MQAYTSISLVPRLLCGGGGKRAWYTLFTHVPSSLGPSEPLEVWDLNTVACEGSCWFAPVVTHSKHYGWTGNGGNECWYPCRPSVLKLVKVKGAATMWPDKRGSSSGYKLWQWRWQLQQQVLTHHARLNWSQECEIRYLPIPGSGQTHWQRPLMLTVLLCPPSRMSGQWIIFNVCGPGWWRMQCCLVCGGHASSYYHSSDPVCSSWRDSPRV